MKNFEQLESGLWVPDTEIKTHGRYHAKLIRLDGDEEEFEFDNVCTYQGLIALLNIMFTGATQITSWYIGLFSGNYTPVQTDTASTIVSNATEFTSYSGGNRPTFTPAAASGSPTINNGASTANFTFTGSGTIYGAMLMSSATPGSGAGTLFSAAQFGASKNVSSGDQLLLTYTLNAASA